MWQYNYYSNELYHHGVKGMKWGVRKKYKPHPRKSSKKKEDQEEKTKFKLTDKQKKALKIGAAVAATALVAYGGYKLYKKGALPTNKSIKIGAGSLPDSIPETLNFKKFNPKSVDIKTDLNNINPGRGSYDMAYSMNCGNCVMAFEMRRRGYDVQALGNNMGVRLSHFGEFFDKLKSDSFIQMDIDHEVSSLTGIAKGKKVEELISSNISSKYEDGARGALFFPHSFGSHLISWVKENGKINFYDPQKPDTNLTEKLFPAYQYHPNNSEEILTSIRLDNLNIKPSISRMVNNTGSPQSNADFSIFTSVGENWVIKNMMSEYF